MFVWVRPGSLTVLWLHKHRLGRRRTHRPSTSRSLSLPGIPLLPRPQDRPTCHHYSIINLLTTSRLYASIERFSTGELYRTGDMVISQLTPKAEAISEYWYFARAQYASVMRSLERNYRFRSTGRFGASAAYGKTNPCNRINFGQRQPLCGATDSQQFNYCCLFARRTVTISDKSGW